MIKKRKQTRMAWMMAVIILFSVFSPLNMALAATPSSLDADVSVEGVPEGGIIDGSTDIEITVSFPVPVMGDGVTDYFVRGDVVELLLSESFKFDPVPTGSIDLMYGSKKLGTVVLSNNMAAQAVATITFDGDADVFDPEAAIAAGYEPWSGVSGEFKASLKYNGNHNTDGDGNKTVSILEKTYQLQLPGDTIVYSVEKTGVADMDAGTITWSVKITAAKDTEPTPTPIDLAGYVFEDDLAGVGKYVGGSFSPTGGTLVVPSDPATKLTYTFPTGAVSPQTITFKTEISESVLTAGGDITNGAGLYLDDVEVGFDDFEVTITKPSATKTGEAKDGLDPGTGDYDPSNRTITWYIEVDNEGRTLNDLVITDELKDGLTLESAQWQKETAPGVWEDVSGANWSSIPTDNEYKISEKIGGGVDYKGRLKIVSKVPDSTDGSVTEKIYKNQASVSWSGSGGTTGSAGTENIGVGIGYDAITKNGAQSTEDVDKHQITWTINTDMKGQSTADFTVYDLFVHDAATSNGDLTSASGWPSGLSIGTNNITRNNGQKFVEIVSQASGLTVTHTDLKNSSDEVIATLVKITNLNASASNQVVLKSQVLDPSILAGNNQNQKVSNTAALYKGTTFRGQAKGDVDFNNKILSKELLNRAEVGNDHTTGAGSINANNRTINVANGFHYGYKEVIFRLNVNAAGLDFANVETNQPGGFGNVVITDTLPAGWEFAKFSDGQDYLIYDTTGTLSTGTGFPATGSLTTSGSALSPVSGLTADFAATGDPRTATFTFTNLDQPYVILVKARPTDATFAGYLEGDNTRTETNTLGLRAENWIPGISVNRGVRVDSKVLAKTLDLSKQTQGILTWNVRYTPFGQEIGSGLEDTLPEGIDLRTDSSGQLIWEQDGSRNINVHELTLKSDGSGEYITGAELSLEDLKSSVSYDNDTRKLTFTFPDKSKAYELSYVTDITGMPGAVTNAVKLMDATGTGTSTEQGFTITAQQGAATMGRSGYLVVEKTDIGGAWLSDAEFTLYNTNADGSKGSVRAVRTTGSDGIIKFYGLAPGNYILVETQTPGAAYENSIPEYNVVVGSDLKTTVNGSGIITSDDPFVVVNYKDTDAVGSLTIRKTVAGDDADTTKEFEFTLTLDEIVPGNAYTYIGYGVPSGAIKSGETISLAHGQSITIVGIPNGTTYTVTEADYGSEGYIVTSTGTAGTIATNTTQAASFTNTKNTPSADSGNLTISKTVVGTTADPAKTFFFRITLTDAPGTYPYTGNGVPGGTMKSGTSIALAHGQSITITGLPIGATYKVTEADYSGDGYTVESANAAGSIASGITQTAAFTNTKADVPPPDTTGSLTISKTVAGNAADTSKSFDFTLTLNGADGLYAYTGHGVPDGTMKSGEKVSLAHGQSITITGLPIGATYEVTEADYSGDGYSSTSTDATGNVAEAAQTASFTNTRNVTSVTPTGNLTIKKTVSGDLADQKHAFTFVVELSVSGVYPYSGSKTGTIQSGQTVTLKHGEYIIIENLPVGTTYLVTEQEANQGGYVTNSTGASGVIVEQGQTAAFVNSRSSVPKTGDDDTGVIGKIGLIVSISLLLVLIGADYVLRTKRRKRHR